MALRWLLAVLSLAALVPAPQSGWEGLSEEVAAQLAEDVLPDKGDNHWTTSSQFKMDLVSLFSKSSHETVLELGAHLGHCTRVLSRLFRTVLAVEHSAPVLDQNVERNSDLSNVVYLQLHTVLDDWGLFSKTPIKAVFIDAAHDYRSVKSDLERTLALPYVHTIVLDDYGTRKGVRQAVQEIVSSGAATIRRFVGRSPPWTYGDVTVDDWEGVVLDPVPRGLGNDRQADVGPRLVASLIKSSWVVFPAGVFSDGYFTPDGTITLEGGGAAVSSYGAFEWRQALPGELEEGEEYGSIILQLLEAPRWRFQGKVNKHRTGMALLRNDGKVLVAVRQDMMRLVGDKLISFLH